MATVKEENRVGTRIGLEVLLHARAEKTKLKIIYAGEYKLNMHAKTRRIGARLNY